MRVRTSVTLPKDLLIKVDALAGKKHKRSAIVESALRDYVAKENGKKLNRRDIEIINANADKLNEEALDTLEYQQVNWRKEATFIEFINRIHATRNDIAHLLL
jgi:metal-responsive CopG/Arc/MetJ family transcriptional regulator